MTTSKQAEANRRNALQSTGPRSPKGKARAAKNALKHGLLARTTLLPDEDGEALEDLRGGVHADLHPAGELDAHLVDRIVDALWRLQRIRRVEGGVYRLEMMEHALERLHKQVPQGVSDFLGDVLESRPTPPALQAKLDKARADREQEEDGESALAVAFGRTIGGDTFGKLARYEAHLERTLYRALHELQRLQAARSGGKVVAPVAVDVSVAGGG